MKKYIGLLLLALIPLLSMSQDNNLLISENEDSIVKRVTIDEFPKNFICAEYGFAFWIDIYYERMFPVSKNIGLTLRSGPSIGAGFVGGGNVEIHGGTGVVFGKNRHLGYIAVGLRHEFGEEEYRDSAYTTPYIEAFYRHVAYNGLVLKVGVEYIVLSVGIGYSF